MIGGARNIADEDVVVAGVVRVGAVETEGFDGIDGVAKVVVDDDDAVDVVVDDDDAVERVVMVESRGARELLDCDVSARNPRLPPGTFLTLFDGSRPDGSTLDELHSSSQSIHPSIYPSIDPFIHACIDVRDRRTMASVDRTWSSP